MGRHEQKFDTSRLLQLRLSVWRIPIHSNSCTSLLNLKVIQLLSGGSRRTSVRHTAVTVTTRECKYFQRNCHCDTGHILPANVHLFHEGKFPPKVYIWEKRVQKFSVARETVFQCSEREQLVLPCRNSLILCGFLQLLCALRGLVPLFSWRWPFIIVSCLLLPCAAQMTFFLSDNSLQITARKCDFATGLRWVFFFWS